MWDLFSDDVNDDDYEISNPFEEVKEGEKEPEEKIPEIGEIEWEGEKEVWLGVLILRCQYWCWSRGGKDRYIKESFSYLWKRFRRN